MSDFNLLAATRAIEKSMPYVLYRLLICLGIALAYLFLTLAGAGTAIAFGYLAKNPAALAPFGAVLGFVGCGYLIYRARAQFLHGVKAGQWALLADQQAGRAIPAGKEQIDYARQRVNGEFPGAGELLALDTAIRQTLADRAALSEFSAAAEVSVLKRAWTWLAGRLFALNDQALLAWHFQSGRDNAWRTAAAALPILAQHYPVVFRYRIYASLVEWVGFAAGFALLSAAFKMMTAGFPVAVGLWPFVFGAVFAWALKSAFFEPIGTAALMDVVFPLFEKGDVGFWEAELDQKSEAYRAIKARAAG